jgi:hypothetical protein
MAKITKKSTTKKPQVKAKSATGKKTTAQRAKPIAQAKARPSRKKT